MAEEKKEEEKEAIEEPKKSKSKLIIIILVVLLLIGAGVGAFFALSGESADKGADLGIAVEVEKVRGIPGAIYPLDTFIVNLSVKGSFLKTSIQLEFYEPKLPPTFDVMIPRVRDAIIQILSSKSSSDILSVEGKERLREEIINAVNETIAAEDIAQIYFTEFIVQ